MEKLELKHLAPYLPYELKVMRSKIPNTDDFEKVTLFPTMLDSGWFNIRNYKPILRPLSDLTKQLEYMRGLDRLDQWTDSWFDHVFDFQDKIREAYILSCPYDLMQELLSMHFDVFGLIEKGIAIDINTLK